MSIEVKYDPARNMLNIAICGVSDFDEYATTLKKSEALTAIPPEVNICIFPGHYFISESPYLN